MAQTPWVTCSSAHSMGTLWEMLLLKPKPVAICSSCSIPRTPCGCWGLQVLQSHPFSRLPLVPHSLSQCQCPALRPPKHPPACHIFPVPGDKCRCSIWMWSDRSHTDRDNPFLDQLPDTAQIVCVFQFTQKEITAGLYRGKTSI